MRGVPERFPGCFLTRFLGHTPSFRRFRRANHEAIPGLVQTRPNRASRWANLMASEYGYKIRRITGRSLNVLLGPNDE